MPKKSYQTIIIGAGPAGLATACSLISLGVNDFLLIERGRALAQRKHATSQDIPSGVGGAGLFSDGKFSFSPSASWLWKNLLSENLTKSYDWLKTTLQTFNVSAPTLTLNAPIEQSNLVFKPYPSFYIDFNNRYKMIDRWIQQFSSYILTETVVNNIEKCNTHYCLTTPNEQFFAENIVIATGRMGPLQLSSFTLPLSSTFQRIEIGVRIKGLHTHPFFNELQSQGNFLDPKFIFTHENESHISWRTFCFCKRGEIIHSGIDTYVTVSGRADCPPTQESNIGFNVRIQSNTVRHLLPKLRQSFQLNLKKVYLNPELLSKYYDPLIANYLFLGLLQLKKYFPSLEDANTLEIVGPTIEGVGNYPIVNKQLETETKGIYVAGDSVGLFRGLTAALLSGHYIGQQIMGHVTMDAFIPSIVNL